MFVERLQCEHQRVICLGAKHDKFRCEGIHPGVAGDAQPKQRVALQHMRNRLKAAQHNRFAALNVVGLKMRFRQRILKIATIKEGDDSSYTF